MEEIFKKSLSPELTEGIPPQKIEEIVKQNAEQFMDQYEKQIGESIKSEMMAEYTFNYMNQVEDIVKELDPKWFQEIKVPLKKIESIVRKK